MKTSDFDYTLPQELIAHTPIVPRDHARLLVINRKSRTWSDHRFDELPHLLDPTDQLVINTTKVIPARLRTRRKTGANIEVLLSEPSSLDPYHWIAMIKSAKKLKINEYLHISPEHALQYLGPSTQPGMFHVKFIGDTPPMTLIHTFGEMPLPPYISPTDQTAVSMAKTHYQSVFAQHEGAIAAPTASLHFTPALFDQISRQYAPPIPVTLHVGMGTFQPIKTAHIHQHHMHYETYSITHENAEKLTQSIQNQAVVAVGTTVVRTLESAFQNNRIVPGTAQTNIFIYPGISIQTVSKLITNFHLPKSTLLMLICAFADRELILAAYHHAIAQKYRFFSYGDAMMII